MSATLGNYIDNLNGIYAAKGSIKTVLETESNDLAYYSTLITNKLETSYTAGYSYGYDIGYADGEDAGGDGTWEPLESKLGALDDFELLGGTEDQVELLAAPIYAFSREALLDKEDGETVVGYRFDWETTPYTITEGNTHTQRSVHVVYDAMLDNGSWPMSEYGEAADNWFSFACEGEDVDQGFISDYLGNIVPILRNVTLSELGPSSDYYYEMHFESLVYENYHGEMNGSPEFIDANGNYPVNSSVGYTVDIDTSLDPNNDIVKDASKWQVFNYLAPSYNVMSLPTINDYAIEAMDIEWYAELCDNLGAPAVVAVDMFNPRGTVEVIAEGQGVTTDYQMNDPEDPDTNAYISIDIDLDEGQSVGLSFAQSTDDGNGAMFLYNIYWCLNSNTNGTHWLMNATTTGTYNILLEANGNGGCTMTITEPEPEP